MTKAASKVEAAPGIHRFRGGVGAAAGAIIGGIVGGGKGAVIGADPWRRSGCRERFTSKATKT